MAATLDDDRYVSWVSSLSPAPGYAPLVAVSASAALGVFALGYVVSAVGGLPFSYLRSPDFSPAIYLSAGGIFWTLAWLGWAEQVYVDMWNEVRPAFAVTDDAYREAVGPWLERIHDEGRLLGYWVAFAAPGFLLISVVYLPVVPSGIQASVGRLLLGGVRPSATVAAVNYLYFAVGSALLVTACYTFANHLFLLGDVSELPLGDPHTAASDLEPVVRFSMATSTAWFVGVSVVVVWTRIQRLNPAVESASVLVLVLVGVVIFAAPTVIVHVALADAKRDALTDARREYEAIHRSMERGEHPVEELTLRLEVTDRRLESARSIRTWPYDVRSAGKLATAAVIPWLTLVREVLVFLGVVGGG